MITEGPFARTGEPLAGWFIAECKDQDEAIDLATTIPAAWYGAIEVRPARQMSHRPGGRAAAINP